MAASVWKGSIVLSLISIPIKLYAAARSERTYLHQIHKECNTRLRQPLFCPHCNRFVDRGEVVKGYEFDEGQYVLMEDKELKKIAAASSHSLEIVAFTKLKEIDPIFYDASYFCIPEESTWTCAAYDVFFERNSPVAGIRSSGTRQHKTAGDKTDGAADCFID